MTRSYLSFLLNLLLSYKMIRSFRLLPMIVFRSRAGQHLTIRAVTVAADVDLSDSGRRRKVSPLLKGIALAREAKKVQVVLEDNTEVVAVEPLIPAGNKKIVARVAAAHGTTTSAKVKVVVDEEIQVDVQKESPAARDDVNAAAAEENSATFESLQVSHNTKKAIIEIMKYKTMTEVQSKAIPVVLAGHDVVVKARTGTGKTLAFLIPAIELLIKQRARYTKAQRSSTPMSQPMLLVLSPTRELAIQIAEEAKKLCTLHKFHVLTLVGGTNVESDRRAMASRKAASANLDIVVATPGRMKQHLEETHGFSGLCKGVGVLVLDEADRLLDMGFKKDLDHITSFLLAPDTRQTLLFSATYSSAIKEVAASFLRKGYSLVDAVGEEQEQTHASVKQEVVTVPVQLQQRYLIDVLERQLSQPGPFKVMVFFPTARQTAFMAAMARAAGIDVMEIHSRKSQGARNRASEDFRAAKRGIMFSSDVSARGMDYPDVSLVVQVGMTSHEQYIHRLGRTARAGKEGKGLLICAPFETQPLLRDLQGLPIVLGEEVNLAYLKAQSPSGKYEKAVRAMQSNESGDKGEKLCEMAEDCWGAWLGFYNSQRSKLGWSTDGLVKAAGEFASSLGLKQMPAVPKRTLSKMGLLNVPGLNAEENTPRKNGGGRGRRGGAESRGPASRTEGRGGDDTSSFSGGGSRGGGTRVPVSVGAAGTSRLGRGAAAGDGADRDIGGFYGAAPGTSSSQGYRSGRPSSRDTPGGGGGTRGGRSSSNSRDGAPRGSGGGRGGR